jgi:hypothetical protein
MISSRPVRAAVIGHVECVEFPYREHARPPPRVEVLAFEGPYPQ